MNISREDDHVFMLKNDKIWNYPCLKSLFCGYVTPKYVSMYHLHSTFKMHTMSHFETVDVFSSSAEQLTVLSEQNKTKTTELYKPGN